MERARRLVDEGVPVAPAVGRVVVRHELLGRLDRAERVAQVSGPAGSGKTVLLRSWLNAAGLGGRTAWVSVPEGERNPQRFWVAVADALRGTAPGAGVLRPLTAAPDLDGWAVVERLLADMSRLPKRIWLVIDDLHELAAEEARHQLELLILRAPEKLRFVLAGRHELGLGLHRLRLEGALTEIRGSELRMTLPEVRGLFAAADIAVPDAVLEALHERTEGWAAGLRLAALSLAGHPDP
ncbi:MAG TPA: AAA family ATPase, partial [Trebonia sp.]|nr:AAA family ATPase [Trebonia sp.]